MEWSGTLHKLKLKQADTVCAMLPADGSSTGETLELNSFLDRHVRLYHDGRIRCVHCDTPLNKTYGEGCCWTCFTTLPQNDICILKPELCHFHDKASPCRDPQWGLDNCFKPHVLYLALTAGVKVGITRVANLPTRWLDQGATRATAVLQVEDRFSVGLLERQAAQHFSDRTSWQRMLKGDLADAELSLERKRLLQLLPTDHGAALLEFTEHRFQWPVIQWPTKVKSLSLQKQPEIRGSLLGIKGQYLILDVGVVNMRRHAGLHLDFAVD